jgi:hypothetical protein
MTAKSILPKIKKGDPEIQAAFLKTCDLNQTSQSITPMEFPSLATVRFVLA